MSEERYDRIVCPNCGNRILDTSMINTFIICPKCGKKIIFVNEKIDLGKPEDQGPSVDLLDLEDLDF